MQRTLLAALGLLLSACNTPPRPTSRAPETSAATVAVEPIPPLRWSAASAHAAGAAVLIAADTYAAHPSWTLPNARASAEVMRTMLIERSGVPQDAIEIVTDRDVRAEVVEAKIRAAGEHLRAAGRGVLWVYFAGHANVQDGEQNLFMHATRQDAGSPAEVLPRRDVVRWMAAARAACDPPCQAIFVVDAWCRDAAGGPRAHTTGSEVWEVHGVRHGTTAAGSTSFGLTQALADAATALASSTVEADLDRLFAEARSRTLEHSLAPEPQLRRPTDAAMSAIVVAGRRVPFAVRVIDGLTGAPLATAHIRLDDQPAFEAAGDSPLSGAHGEHLLSAHAAGYLPRTERVRLDAQRAGATLLVPLQPSLTVITGRVHPPGAFTVRAECPDARPGYHVLESALDGDGRFQLRVPSLTGVRAEVLQAGRSVTQVELPPMASAIAADSTGAQDGIGQLEVAVFLPHPAVQRPATAPQFASPVDRADWTRALRLADTGRYDLAREAAEPLTGIGLQQWRRWLDSRWAECWLDDGLRDGMATGDWSKADAVAAWWSAAPRAVDNEARVRARMQELGRERMPRAVRQRYDEANAALTRTGFEEALTSYKSAHAELPAHYQAIVAARIERLQAHLYERHMMAGALAELEADAARALAAYARACEFNRRAAQAVRRLLAQHPELANTPAGRDVALRASIRLAEWAEVVDAALGTSGLPRKVRDTRSGIVFVLLEAGEFVMGSTKGEGTEQPVHRVRISKPFYLAETETTQEQWLRVLASNPSRFRGSQLPVDSVCWNDVAAFLRQLNGSASGPFRLPTEAEWEYAARAGTTTDYACGDTVSTDLANYNGNYAWGNSRKGVFRAQTVEVGAFPGNAWGLRNMHGNVAEWCHDWYAGDYYGQSADGVAVTVDPAGPAAGASRTVRGGSWRLYPRNLRSASRYDAPEAARLDHVGFRVARSI